MGLLEQLGHYFSLGTFAGALAAILLATMGRKAGLVVAAADIAVVVAYRLYELTGGGVVTGKEVEPVAPLLMNPFGFPLAQLFWTAALLAVGFGFEPLLRRFGVSLFRLDRNVMMGAAIGMVVVLFAVPLSGAGFSAMVIGAFLGALAGGLFSGVAPQRAFKDALGSLLGLFGGDGLRLMCTLGVVTLVVRTWAG